MSVQKPKVIRTNINRLQAPARMKACMAKWRRAALAALGGVCVRCGFADVRALQIDHVNGGGLRERSRRRQKDNAILRVCLTKYYRQVVEDQTGKFQLLCANCNWIKRAENGEGQAKPEFGGPVVHNSQMDLL